MIEWSASDEFKKLPSTVMRCHFHHWHSQVATGKDEVLAAVDIEGMRWESGEIGSDPLLEVGTHCRYSAGLLQGCCRLAPLTWRIVHTEIDRMVDSKCMEHTLVVA